jgi:hypothetical protein
MLSLAKFTQLLLVAALTVLRSAGAATPREPSAVVLKEATRIADSGYMSPRGQCKPVEVVGYEGLPTKRCNYKQGKLRAEVILLDPSGPQLAKWVNAVCISLAADAKPVKECSLALLRRVAMQSSGHFPVAGVVLEDGKVYAFRDGVTVQVAAFRNGTTTPLTQEQIEAAVSAPVIGWGKFARLQGTTYDDYRRYGRLTDQDGKLIDDSSKTFPELVGFRWREDWGREVNFIMRAWACGNLKAVGLEDRACVAIPLDAPGAARNTPAH